MEPVVVFSIIYAAIALALIAEAETFGFQRSRRNVALCLLWGPVVVLAFVGGVLATPYVLLGKDGLLNK